MGRSSAPPVGSASLLAIFAVLCMTVLALLSLSQVLSDQRLAQAQAQTVTDYYAADAAAQQTLARLRGGQIPQGVGCQGEYYEYSCPISHTQTLAVRVWVRGEDYQILRWQVVSTTAWQAEDRLPVYTG